MRLVGLKAPPPPPHPLAWKPETRSSKLSPRLFVDRPAGSRVHLLAEGSGFGFRVYKGLGSGHDFEDRGNSWWGPHRLHGSSFLGLPDRIPNYEPQKGTTMEPMGRVISTFLGAIGS